MNAEHCGSCGAVIYIFGVDSSTYARECLKKHQEWHDALESNKGAASWADGSTELVLVQMESPYAGSIEGNLAYARAAMRDCFQRGEAPFASHLLYTQRGVLDDTLLEERSLGIGAGLLWGAHAAKVVIYTDLGISSGMAAAIKQANQQDRVIAYRQVPEQLLLDAAKFIER